MIRGVLTDRHLIVRANAALIADGDTSPDSADSTDFGGAPIGFPALRGNSALEEGFEDGFED
jgi:hypothetical protein